MSEKTEWRCAFFVFFFCVGRLGLNRQAKLQSHLEFLTTPFSITIDHEMGTAAWAVRLKKFIYYYTLKKAQVSLQPTRVNIRGPYLFGLTSVPIIPDKCLI